MRLRVTYTEEGERMVLVTISVLDPEDYPTRQVFQNQFDYPTTARFRLGVGKSTYITCSFPYATEAVLWAQDQISALKGYMTSWRGQTILETQIVTV